MKRIRNTLLLASMALILSIVPALAQELPPDGLPVPQVVSIAGDFQGALGCAGDWNTDCAATYLALDGNSLVWRGTFEMPAGSHQYKVALNESWTDNFGLGGEYYGENIPLELAEPTLVTFIYSHETYFVTDNVNSIIANVPGSFQDEIGCSGDWAPDCLRSWLQDPDGDGIYTWQTTWIPQGDYEAKVAVNESWAENYGTDGALDGGNIPFSVGEFEQVTFTWDSETKIMTIESAPAPEGAATAPPAYDAPTEKPQPATVTIPGTLQSVLGCPGDWQPDCSNTFLEFDPVARIWTGSFDLPAGDYEYKAALNGNWDVNFGINASQGGSNIPLSLDSDQTVTFFYDHQTGWVTDSVNTPIYTLVGDFQSALGCEADNDASCLVGWLQDPQGSGVFSKLLRGVPIGSYTAAVALGGDSENLASDTYEFTVNDESGVVYFEFDSASSELKIAEGEPKGDLTTQKAYWVLQDTVLWGVPSEAASFELVYSEDASLSIEPTGLAGVTGGISMTIGNSIPADTQEKFPHLSNLTPLVLDADSLEMVPDLLRAQVAVVAYSDSGAILDATVPQIPGVLDDLYTYDGTLGLAWADGTPSFHLWAPTARSVTLNIYNDPGPNVFPQAFEMTRDDATGVWSFDGEARWDGRYYAYEVDVYVPSTGSFETNVVTDPYSVGLSTNGFRSLVIDLDDPGLFPGGWSDTPRPDLAAPEDIVVYELHMRDFSVFDSSVPEELRGTFMAFTVADSNGMAHLRALAEAGLTHLHLLPVFDMASVNEDKSTWTSYDFDGLAGLASDSEEQQAAISGDDAFNWGYDPVHYGVPDGAYTTDPDGSARIIEFRQMVQSLHEIGLRVVMDVVYNHTNASGQRPNSVLDKVVPGYYHRLNDRGQVETSTCCQNTATEHNMMRKLMVDMSVLWATAYGVDGFRFDLMGHHMVADMVAVQDALHAIDPSLYVYGEGWDFGEVASGARGTNATQLNLAGTGIGTFNDRVRDSVRGGSPFGGHTEQGFATGLYTDPNGTSADADTALAQLLLFSDRIRVALAGNLADYAFTGASGDTITGADVDYNGSPTGYAQDPQEHIIYISAHDNETWFDAVQYKAPEGASVADRVRMHNLGVSLAGYSQGIPFFHAGIDMLRSKSFDRDSYNSGDWFNRLDFTYQDNAWGSGLPVADKNQENWGLMAPLLANPELAPGPQDITAALMHFQETLQIRMSSPLFRLQTAEEVAARVAFHNTGPDQVPGLIVMTLSDRTNPDLDTNYESVVVLFNAGPEAVTFTLAEYASRLVSLHPVQASSFDAVVQGAAFDPATGTFTVPGRTTAVFVEAPPELDTSVLPPTATPSGDAPTAAPETSGPDNAPPEEPSNGLLYGVLAAFAAIFGGGLYLRWRRSQSK